MYVRIQFDNIDSEESRTTLQLFLGAPNGTCLSSMNSKHISTVGNSAVWYLDVAVLNQHYSGVLTALNHLKEYAGVAAIDVLPLEGKPADLTEEDVKMLPYQ